jgi:hypothetical protein
MVIWCTQTYYALGLHVHLRIMYFNKKCTYLLLDGREECVLVSMSVSLLVRVTSMLLLPIFLSACLPACLPALSACLPAGLSVNDGSPSVFPLFARI